MAAEPQPKIDAVTLDVDLFPREQRVRMKGTLRAREQASRPVGRLLLAFAPAAKLVVHRLDLGVPSRLEKDDAELGVRIYRLDAAARAGREDRRSPSTSSCRPAASRNEGSNTAVVYNGTLRQRPGRAAADRLPGSRRARARPRPQEVRPRAQGAHARPRRSGGPGGERPRSATPTGSTSRRRCSTEPDQIAIAPGYLQREWTEDGRRYFHYKMDAPILNFFAFLSARYAVKKDAWAGPSGTVAIEIYYQPGHEYNLDSMIYAVKDVARLLQRRLRPYQHRQVRILEFPRYATFAQSFPNTIPYSEAIGFIARVRPDDPKDIDYPYYVTAHEVAHQWWAHQVIGGDVQGGTMLVEIAGAVLGADGDEEEVRRRPRCAASSPTSWTATCSAARSSRRRSCRCRAWRTSPTSTTEGQPGVVRAAGLHRRGQAQPGDPHLPRRPCLQGPALPEQRGAGAAHPRGRRRPSCSTWSRTCSRRSSSTTTARSRRRRSSSPTASGK